MKKIGMFWGSSSDNTKTAAEFISEYLEMNDVEIESFDIAEIGTDKILDLIILLLVVLLGILVNYKKIGMQFLRIMKNLIFQERLPHFLDVVIKLVILIIFLMQ